MRPFAIAGLQLQLPAGEDNVERIESRIDAAMETFPWVEMVVVSELAAFGPSTARAEPMPGPTEARFALLAKKHGIWLLPGTLFEKLEGKVYNTASVID